MEFEMDSDDSSCDWWTKYFASIEAMIEVITSIYLYRKSEK